MYSLKTYPLYISLVIILLLAACGSRISADIKSDIQYGQNERYQLDAFLCKDRNESSPLVILIHPGAWVSGDKAIVSVLADSLFQNGINIININMRYASDSVHLADLMEDIDTLKEFLKQQAKEWRIHTDQVILGGSSSGAHLAIYYSYTHHKSGWVKGTFGFATPSHIADTNWLRLVDTMGIRKDVEAMVGAKWVEGAALDSAFYWADIQSNISPVPTYLIHGDKDVPVPYEQSQNLYRALQAQNIPVELYTLKDMGHEIGGRKPEVFKEVIRNLSSWIHRQYPSQQEIN